MLSRRSASLPALIVVVACISNSKLIAQPWLGGETIGPAGVQSGHAAVSLDLDTFEIPCVAYYDGDDGDLKFGEYVEGAWTVTTVDTTGDTGQYCALAIDSFGEPHIAYYFKLEPDATSADHLKYAWRSGGNWTIETVDDTDVAGFVDLVLDDSDQPHITYFDGFRNSLEYATKSGSWTLQTIDTNGTVGQHGTLIIDGLGDLHVAYQDAGNMGVRYAVNSGSGWTVNNVAGLTTFPPAAYTAVQMGLVLDSAGAVHIVFRDENTGKSHYSQNTSGTWSTTIARSLGQDLQGSFHSLQMGAGDVPIMAFFDNYWQDVRLATFDGTWWVPKPIRPDGIATSLAIDSAGNAHIAYHVPQAVEVMYSYESDAVSDARSGDRTSRVSLSISPNPMRSSTTLLLRTAVSIQIGMQIHDSRGRLVRDISQRTHEPGLSYVTWDGRDNSGQRVGAGVYFAVSRPGNMFAPRKIVVVR